MIKTALQSALVGIVTSSFALWARFGLRWWPASPLEKAAFFAACPACPVDVASGRPAIHTAIGLVIVCAVVYALIGMGLEAARRMRRGEWRES